PTTPQRLSSTLFPYTTLFRSGGAPFGGVGQLLRPFDQPFLDAFGFGVLPVQFGEELPPAAIEGGSGRGEALPQLVLGVPFDAGRSEEHTSELQSRFELVCRLLLDKKKRIYDTRRADHVNII